MVVVFRNKDEKFKHPQLYLLPFRAHPFVIIQPEVNSCHQRKADWTGDHNRVFINFTTISLVTLMPKIVFLIGSQSISP